MDICIIPVGVILVVLKVEWVITIDTIMMRTLAEMAPTTTVIGGSHIQPNIQLSSVDKGGQIGILIIRILHMLHMRGTLDSLTLVTAGIDTPIVITEMITVLPGEGIEANTGIRTENSINEQRFLKKIAI